MTRVKAVTDNAYLVTTDGPTAEKAVERANAISTIYLKQRNDEAKALLTNLAEQAQDRSKTATQQSRSLVSQIDEAIQRGDNQTAAAHCATSGSAWPPRPARRLTTRPRCSRR